MGESIDKQFSSATVKWDNIIESIKDKFKKEFENDKHWTFVISDVMKQLCDDQYQIGIINKIGPTNIVDVDWIDNGSLVLYTQSPLLIDQGNTKKNTLKKERNDSTQSNGNSANHEQDESKSQSLENSQNHNIDNLNNLQLKQYKIRYRYISKNDIDKQQNDMEEKEESKTNNPSGDDSDDNKDDLDSEDQLLLNEMDEQENDLWITAEWIEITINNSENEFLSTIPLKINPYCINNEKLLNDLQERYRFVYICQFMEIEIQICCQFILIEQNMSFWTKYSSIYNVNQNNIVLNDNLRIDPDSNQFVIDDSLQQQNHDDINHLQQDQSVSINIPQNDPQLNGSSSSYISTINGSVNRSHSFGGNSNNNMIDSYHQYNGIDIGATHLHNSNNPSMVSPTNNNHSINGLNGNQMQQSRSIASGFGNIQQPHLPQFNVSRIMSQSINSNNINNINNNNNHQQIEQRQASATPPTQQLLGHDTNIIIGDEQIGDNLLLQSGMVRAWRYDEEQDKWRGRGKGNLLIYKNAINNITRIVFKDVKHENKVRLLQKIDVSYAHCTTNYQNEIEWNGNDYSMDPHHPLNSTWKLKFIDQPDKIQEFVAIFNGAVDDCLIKH